MDSDEHKAEKSWMNQLKVPGMTGVYTIAGVYVARWWMGSQTPLETSDLAKVFAISASASWLSPVVANKLGVPLDSHLLTAGVSAGLTYPILLGSMGASTGAVGFAGIQFASQVLADMVANKWKKRGMSVENLPGKVSPCGLTGAD
jgi:hypothetical protein